LDAAQEELAFVLEDPFDGLALGEFHRLGDGGGKVDVPLLTVPPLDELDFGGVAQDRFLSLSSLITR
jgi:hypothetical protein